jgi:fructan beta-fructosidase
VNEHTTSVGRWRPRWHYTAERNWLNDPNGLVFVNGEYHLLYQYNPFGDQWGHMSWGHAVSTDLLHWQELPVAIAEDERVSIYSGSIVVDTHNSSGFGAPGQAPLVAVYTGCRRVPEGGQAQELAYSTDRGHTWTKYAGNPVLDIGLKEFRDPKVFWHTPTARWVMAVVRPYEHQVSFYASNDLKVWKHLSDFGPSGEVGGIWECPDLIEFPCVDGALSCWLLKVDTFAGHPGGTGAQIFIGHFDGTRFTPERPPGTTCTSGQWADHGSDFYAALSWAHLPRRHRAPLWIAWMNNHGYAKATPTAPWRGAMSVPRELFLRDTPDGPRLGQRPWRGLAALRSEPRKWADLHLSPDSPSVDLAGLDSRSLELQWDIVGGDADEFALQVRCGDGEQTVIGVDRRRGTLYIDRSRSGQVVDAARWAGRREAPLPNGASPLRLQVLLDTCSVEVFTGDGAATLTELIFPSDASRGVRLVAHDGELRSRLTAWPLAATR